jgi:MinD-like ATPase involved in chromosome partitioning or flagellar assembly
VSTGALVAVGPVGFEPAVLSIASSPDVHVVRRCVDIADLVATAASRQAAVALVSAHLHGLDAEIVDRLRGEHVAVIGVVAESSSADEALLRQIGISQVASADDPVSLAELVVEAVARPSRTAPADGAGEDRSGREVREHLARSGRVVAVWGPTGAPGRSTVALGLSAELARLSTPTLLIDADVYGGSIAARLGMLDESSGLLAAARAANTGSLSAEVLARHAREVAPQLRVLSGLPRADRWTEVKPVLLRNVLAVSRSLSAFTVVDCGFSLELDEEISYDTSAPRRNGATIEALASADTTLVVGGADPVGLARLIRGVHELKTVIPDTTPILLVNRVRSGLGWSDGDIVATVQKATGGRAAIRLLPDDPTACDKGLVHGRSLSECAPDARLTRALRSLATEVVDVGPGPGVARRSLPRRR